MNSPNGSQRSDTDPTLSAMAVAAFAMASLSSIRSSGTGNRILRIQHYLKALAQRLQAHPPFTAVLTESYISRLFYLAPLHDMGSIGVPDRILLKPSRLTVAEFAILKTHTTLAGKMIEQAEEVLGFRADLLNTLKEMTVSHHEKWDGTGYPQGLSADQVPLAARLLAVVDVYEALISDRVYKTGIPHDEAVAVIFQGRSSQFDPDIVDAFIEIKDEFQAIAGRFADSDQDRQRMIEYMANAIAEEVEW